MKKFVVSLLTAILSISLYGAGIRQEYERDMKDLASKVERLQEEDGSTVGMIEAEKVEEKGLRELMEKYYGKLMGFLGEDEGVLLEISQKKWEEYRKREVDFYIKYYDREGSIWGLYFSERKNDLLRRRTELLVDLSEEVEED